MASICTRQPGAIKLVNSSNSNQDCLSKKQTCKQSSVACLNLSEMGLRSLPKQYGQIQVYNICDLLLDFNSIQQCFIDFKQYRALTKLSMTNNGMKKFSLKKLLTQTVFSPLQHLDLSQNNLQFLDLSSLCCLETVNLCHNHLQTLILPNQTLKFLNISQNMFSNIQYSVLNSKTFPKLQKFSIKNNKKSLYDLILSINGQQLLPNLKQLYCSDNMISYMEGISQSLQVLDIQRNQMIFDRILVNQFCRLKNLTTFKIGGNIIGNGFINIIKQKIGNRLHILQGQSNFYKQSPYRIYEDYYTTQGKQTQKVTYSNFTLGEDLIYNTERDQQNIDPDYNLIQQTPTLAKQKEFNSLQDEEKQSQQIIPQLKTLKQMQNRLKIPKFKLKIEGQRYHNHYRQYFNQLAHFMIIPPYPILHSSRTINISTRIDPPLDPDYLNQFQLLSEMFRSRGGVHYVRKVFNWQKTQVIGEASIVFVNVEISKKDFEAICQGDYRIIDNGVKMKHAINLQPSSFSCYHLLGRVNKGVGDPIWSCFYIIQAVHL